MFFKNPFVVCFCDKIVTGEVEKGFYVYFILSLIFSTLAVRILSQKQTAAEMFKISGQNSGPSQLHLIFEKYLAAINPFLLIIQNLHAIMVVPAKAF